MYNQHCVFKKWSWDHWPIGSRGKLIKKTLIASSGTENVEQSNEESIVELKEMKAKAKSALQGSDAICYRTVESFDLPTHKIQ